MQVSANTSALNKSFQRLKMSSTVDSTNGTVGDLTDGTFETVADALHLQNSVIGMIYIGVIFIMLTLVFFSR